MAVAGENQGRLEFPHVRRVVTIDLAISTKTQTQIANEWGVSEAAITQFKHRHQREIDGIRQAEGDTYTGIAVARKEARLAIYEQVLEGALRGSPKVAGKDGNYVLDPETGEPVIEVNAGAIAKVVRNIAEELGHLPSRVVVTGDVQVKTNYSINGVDPDNLK